MITVQLARLAIYVAEGHAPGERVAGKVTKKVVPKFSLHATPQAVPLHGLTGANSESCM